MDSARSVMAIMAIAVAVVQPRPLPRALPDVRPGWLEVGREDSDGARTVVLRNRSRMPLHYSSSSDGPPYVFMRQKEGQWYWMGPGWCGNGFEPAVLGPGDSVRFRVYGDHALQGKLRIAVDLSPLDSHEYFYAASEDSFDFSHFGPRHAPPPPSPTKVKR